MQGRQARNQSSWANKENWVFGFYFGHEDTRLWVPKRTFSGPSEEKCIINFSHPLGRPAFRILMLAYAIAGIFFGIVAAVLWGFNW